jgi:hypothetical protein
MEERNERYHAQYLQLAVVVSHGEVNDFSCLVHPGKFHQYRFGGLAVSWHELFDVRAELVVLRIDLVEKAQGLNNSN